VRAEKLLLGLVIDHWLPPAFARRNFCQTGAARLATCRVADGGMAKKGPRESGVY